MRVITRAGTAIVAAATLAISLTACGSSGGAKHDTGPSGPKPLADYAKISGGTTTVTLSSAFVGDLAKLGLVPTAAAPATITTSTITFPVTGGSATVYAKGVHNPQASGSVTHSGGIKLTTASMKVELTDFVLTLGATPTLAGKVLINGQALGNSRVSMFDVDLATAANPTSSAGSTTLSGATVYVDPTAATSLNAAFSLSGTSKALPTTAHALEVGTATTVLKG